LYFIVFTIRSLAALDVRECLGQAPRALYRDATFSKCLRMKKGPPEEETEWTAPKSHGSTGGENTVAQHVL
jgi:hypothetical protein